MNADILCHFILCINVKHHTRYWLIQSQNIHQFWKHSVDDGIKYLARSFNSLRQNKQGSPFHEYEHFISFSVDSKITYTPKNCFLKKKPMIYSHYLFCFIYLYTCVRTKISQSKGVLILKKINPKCQRYLHVIINQNPMYLKTSYQSQVLFTLPSWNLNQ